MKRMRVYSFALVVALACSTALPLSARALSLPAARAERVSPAGEVVVVLSEEFLNSLLQAVASQPEPPTFPLKDGGAGGKCASEVQLLRESGGTRTSVRFVEGKDGVRQHLFRLLVEFADLFGGGLDRLPAVVQLAQLRDRFDADLTRVATPRIIR